MCLGFRVIWLEGLGFWGLPQFSEIPFEILAVMCVSANMVLLAGHFVFTFSHTQTP